MDHRRKVKELKKFCNAKMGRVTRDRIIAQKHLQGNIRKERRKNIQTLRRKQQGAIAFKPRKERVRLNMGTELRIMRRLE